MESTRELKDNTHTQTATIIILENHGHLAGCVFGLDQSLPACRRGQCDLKPGKQAMLLEKFVLVIHLWASSLIPFPCSQVQSSRRIASSSFQQSGRAFALLQMQSFLTHESGSSKEQAWEQDNLKIASRVKG